MAFTRLRGILVPAVLLSACLLSPLAAAEPTVAQLEKQINARNAALLEMQNRVQQQDATIRKLEGQIQDLSERLSALEKGGVRPQIPANPNPPAPDTAVSANPALPAGLPARRCALPPNCEGAPRATPRNAGR